MLKLLRNLVLAGILLAGALKLLAWYAVGQDADRLATALAPFGQAKYDGISAGLDGSVTLNGFTLSHVSTHRIYRADSVTVETPGLFWLLKHALLSENALPPQFAIAAQGLRLPPEPWLNPDWFDLATIAPFAEIGCGTTAFTPADYGKMGLPDAVGVERLEYHYDAEAHTLALSLNLAANGYAGLTVKSDLRPFDLDAVGPWEKLRVEQMSVDYSDDGFLRQRNQFCARRGNIGVPQFIENHIVAVQALLKDHRVEASAELLQLYRNLLEHGGQFSVLSLPSSNFVLGNVRSSQPDDLLRQLNVTARYRDAPPIMFRLAFTPPPEGESPVADALTPGAPSTTPVSTASVTVPPTVTPPAPEKPVPVTAPPVVVASAPVVPVSPPPAPVIKTPAPPSPPPVQTAAAPTTPAAKPEPAKHAGDNLGLHDLDRAEAKLAPPPPAPVVPNTQRKGTEAPGSVIASSPKPPPDSTMALVWKPVIEALPPAPPEQRDYDVIEYAGLKNIPGRRVRLITDGGKKVEGYVISADEGSVILRVRHPDGDAEFEVPKKRIQQVQMLHSPAAF